MKKGSFPSSVGNDQAGANLSEVYYRLPFPPSVNNYTAVARGRKIKSSRGRSYTTQAVLSIKTAGPGVLTFPGRVSVRIQANPCDRRRRDLDNLLKAPLDALKLAGVLADDSQISDLHIWSALPVAGEGYLDCWIREVMA